ncbi:PD-(D/E)XK motif protein [Ruminococcus flavefaciens]|uniref:Putative PD-(D/E)XK family member n=1 Tax=Ruminococcus flavefaciens TaxID=1265 RepID=A0A1K1MI33_RUMFL|nr:PD-(D/E)XK motif protein [Ruminococcus flavefaciens]SFW22729.1 Putative PD-(D/E)XK family member [Ruminococcus flavefaciens]
MTLKERFDTFSVPEYYSRVDTDHILELYIGLDEKGRKSIELRSAFNPRKVKGTSAIEVNQYDNQKYKTIRFSLTDEEISGLFYTFCDDLIEQTRELTDEKGGYNAIVVRFHQWKKMFVSSKKDFLNEAQIMGLIGELLFLRDQLSKRIGLPEALRSWSGQELTHKDFSYGDTWTEVKTIRRSSLTVHISSLEQLDSEHDGELAVYALEKMSTEYNGITLNKLIVDIRNRFSDSDDRDLFMSKVALQGYEYHNYYDDFVFELIYSKNFRVNDTFPKLIPGDVPEAILKATYDIDLNKITDFEIKD